jgi:hypothetical protein
MMGKVLLAIAQALISFHHDKILGVRLPDGRIGVTLLSLCKMLKIAKHGQMERIRRDEVLSKYLVLVIIETARGPQAVEVLIAQAIPTWLTGLQPSMVAPEKRAMILALKEEAVEVLYRHFFHIDQAPPPQPDTPKAAPDSPAQMIADAVQTIGEAVQQIAGAVQIIGGAAQKLDTERQTINEHLAALEQWRETTQERQQAMGEYLVETRERVQALEQRRDEAPYDPKEDDQPVGKTLLSPQHLGQVYVLARQERRRSGQAVSALLAALAQAFGVPDISDLPESAWDDVLGWFWERQRRG